MFLQSRHRSQGDQQRKRKMLTGSITQGQTGLWLSSATHAMSHWVLWGNGRRTRWVSTRSKLGTGCSSAWDLGYREWGISHVQSVGSTSPSPVSLDTLLWITRRYFRLSALNVGKDMQWKHPSHLTCNGNTKEYVPFQNASSAYSADPPSSLKVKIFIEK